ncbi:dead deah box helicase [Pyrenophora seminiperda CCB06]|uniref:Dead deah box helicase n=1 Tax=Pyrenophora seminiperda CCB06 TaxID=1302712 RepID=A0A3M7LZW0_9PLEO|nr:dead deah box helicase [Pyrenophora seminiperda CCB06]
MNSKNRRGFNLFCYAIASYNILFIKSPVLENLGGIFELLERDTLICLFAQTIASLLYNKELSKQLNILNLLVNLADLLNRFLLAALTRDACLRNTLLANKAIKKKYNSLLNTFVKASKNSFNRILPISITTNY